MGLEPLKTSNRIRFGNDYQLDLLTGELRRSGRLLKLERIPTDLLSFLIERQGDMVSREEIIERIWGKDVFLDTDNSINAAVRKVRQVLKDDPAQPRFVQTITGRGYRFIAPITEDSAPVPAEPAPQLQEAKDSANEEIAPARRSTNRGWMIAIAILAALLIAFASYFQWSRSHAGLAHGERVVLAVLPFENLTGDSGRDYFTDGMTEEMISQLGRLDPEHLGVIARTSVMVYKRNPKPLDQIGRELGAQYALEGSVRQDSGKVRITAQLIQLQDQTHVWSRDYDRELSNLLALEGEIAQEIADEIQLTLGKNRKRIEPGRQPALSAEQYQAYDLYLKGQYLWNKRTVPGFQQAIECFQQAIAKDPNFARAYTGLADTYALLGGYSLGAQTEFMSKARAAALRALQIDDSLPEAHTALALIVQNYDWDWQTSEKEYRRAIELNPNYATAHHWYAEHLALLGRFDEALRESERARQLDPLSLIIAVDRGEILYFARQYDNAIQQFRAIQEMDPNFPRGSLVVHVYVQKGLFAEASAQIDRHRHIDGDNAWLWSELVYISGRSGRQAEAQRTMERLQQFYRQPSIDAAAMIWAYAGLGEKDQALAWLEKGYTQHSNALTTLKVEPGYDFLRSDPRFQDLMRRVGLAP